MDTKDTLKDAMNTIEITTLRWAVKMLKKYPVELVISELEKYAEELENE